MTNTSEARPATAPAGAQPVPTAPPPGPSDRRERLLHAFEFMDLPGVPAGLRHTLREILECGNARPFRGYYAWVVDQIAAACRNGQIDLVVELGAGTAPLTRRLVADRRCGAATFLVCDANPDVDGYRRLARAHPGRVRALDHPVDFARPMGFPPRTLAVLSATLHHLPAAEVRRVVDGLRRAGADVLVVEPLRRTLASAIFVLGSLVPALLLPALLVRRPGRLRRIAWCWLLPAAPVLFLWDGLVSCWRQRTAREWMDALAPATPGGCRVRETLFCQSVECFASGSSAG